MEIPLLGWIGLISFIGVLLALDLGVFHRDDHVMSVREAGMWTAIWVSLGLLFNAGILIFAGTQPAVEFLTGYLVEYALSVDNIFVIVLLFGTFAVPKKYQHRVLFWGILGAVVMRGVMIFAGVALLERFQWISYVFGAFLVFAGVRMLFSGAEEPVAGENRVMKLLRRFIPVSDEYDGHNFFTRIDGRLFATPLFLVLIIIELTDLVFAVDSIPAILAITRDPFIVFSSNIFAILGLRSLYFLLSGVIDRFVYLEVGLAVILAFVGGKMLLANWFHPPTWISLLVILLTLLISIIASLLSGKRKKLPGGTEA